MEHARPKIHVSAEKGLGIPISKDRALEIFNLLAGIGYAVSVKHIRGNYYVEVPVRLVGDKAYNAEAEISAIAFQGGFTAIQAGKLLRIA